MSDYNLSEKVVKYLNEAAIEKNENIKVYILKQIKQLILYDDIELLDNFLDEINNYVDNGSTEVSLFLLEFYKDAVMIDVDIIPKVLTQYAIISRKNNYRVRKMGILNLSYMYKATLMWLLKKRDPTEEIKNNWAYICEINQEILTDCIDPTCSLRTTALIFFENYICALSYQDNNEYTYKDSIDDFCINCINKNHPILFQSVLFKEAKIWLDKFLKSLMDEKNKSGFITAALLTCSRILKRRPQFVETILKSFEYLHAALPSMLSKMQICGINEIIKFILLDILKYADTEIENMINLILFDLGVSQNEIDRIVKLCPLNKIYKKYVDSDEQTPKKIYIKRETDTNEEMNAIESTTEDIFENLSLPVVADIVMLSMNYLPSTMSAGFQSSYTSVANSASKEHILHISRLLATQMTSANIGIGCDNSKATTIEKSKITVIPTISNLQDKDTILPSIGVKIPTSLQFRPVKQSSYFNIHAVNYNKKDNVVSLCENTIERFLKASDIPSKFFKYRIQILIHIVCVLRKEDYRKVLLEFIFLNVEKNYTYAIEWLMKEYAVFRKYISIGSIYKKSQHNKLVTQHYDYCLSAILKRLLEVDNLTLKLIDFVTKAPYITPNAISILTEACMDESKKFVGLFVLRQLILIRPCMRTEFLYLFLSMCRKANILLRKSAIDIAKTLLANTAFNESITQYSIASCRLLCNENPPLEIQEEFNKNENLKVESEWTKRSIYACVHLFLHLLELNSSLLSQFTKIYPGLHASTVSTVLGVMEPLIKNLGMKSNHILDIIRNCPVGAEKLIIRICYILTEKEKPTDEIVKLVRTLYDSREKKDIRLLLSIVRGLKKSEILEILPNVVREIPKTLPEMYARIFDLENNMADSAVDPADLIYEIHIMDDKSITMREIMLALNPCMEDNVILKPNIVQSVVTKLTNHEPLPLLSMRTILQMVKINALRTEFLIEIMQKLMRKKTWTTKHIWEGLIRCLDKTLPSSIHLVLELTEEQYIKAITDLPDLNNKVLEIIKSSSSYARNISVLPKHISQRVIQAERVSRDRSMSRSRSDRSISRSRHWSRESSRHLSRSRESRDRSSRSRFERHHSKNKESDFEKPQDVNPIKSKV